jgi:hypothetical protein
MYQPNEFSIINTMATVSRADRLVDYAALVILVIGVALYLDAGTRLRAISTLSYEHPGPRGRSAVAAADRARYESYAGIGMAVAGCLVGVASAMRHSRRQVS